MLQHKFEIENKDGSRKTLTSTLCEYGAPIGSGGYSAMAKLVGVTCGVGKSPHFLNYFGHCDDSQEHCHSKIQPLSPASHKGRLNPHSVLGRGIANVL